MYSLGHFLTSVIYLLNQSAELVIAADNTGHVSQAFALCTLFILYFYSICKPGQTITQVQITAGTVSFVPLKSTKTRLEDKPVGSG